MVNKSLSERAPDVIGFLRNWEFKAADQVATELWMEENNEASDAGALWYPPELSRGMGLVRAR